MEAIAHSCRERKIESSPQSLILHNRLRSVRARTATLLHLSLPPALNHSLILNSSLLQGRKSPGLELDTTTAQAALLHGAPAPNCYPFQVSDKPVVLSLNEEFGCWLLPFSAGNH